MEVQELEQKLLERAELCLSACEGVGNDILRRQVDGGFAAMIESFREHQRLIVLKDDALDHIAKTCDMASQLTNRLQFIQARANTAKAGEQWNRDFAKTPKDQRANRLVVNSLTAQLERKHDDLIEAQHDLAIAHERIEELELQIKAQRAMRRPSLLSRLFFAGRLQQLFGGLA